ATPASALAAPNPGTYVKRTEHDNTPYRFNMTQNGKRMTADDFDAWLQANGYSAGRRAAPAAETPAAAEVPAEGQAQSRQAPPSGRPRRIRRRRFPRRKRNAKGLSALQYAQLMPDAGECVDGAIDVLARVRGRHLRADPRLPLGHDGK